LSGYHLHCGNIDLHPGSWSPDGYEDQISIWRIDLSSQLPALPQLQQLLSSGEKAHAARFHQQKDAQQFILTRAILRILLADRLLVQPGEVAIMVSENKKPVLANHHRVHFNVSHSDNQAVIAIAKQRIGIDVEFIKPGFDYHSIVEYAFSDAEADHLVQSDHPHQEFFRLWTRKEAFLKGLGAGLINDLKKISCMDAMNKIPASITGVNTDWQVKTSDRDPAYIISVAFEVIDSSDQIFLFDFSQAAL
jgi:4'-phosphopantetheinyl transferase